ncbi:MULTISPECIES: hypothetical protein [Neisseriaceae]|jgi:hypothetical protein|uniref:Lipoprotein n=2 Tax=Eikenella corrodens TaxID=539 RepID=V7IDE5_EIKCO|nr:MULTISPECIES: hypothetical protein [Eikenella]ETA82887.1 hypothetical protein HMPREF1177_01969 [Eikenella corrodens CC92I]MDN8581901.1 hypothetical protein [Eikenella corrodens]MDU1346482.1 hypothetical protein [Eikenella corrodens]MDU4300199.1 hypothetical protein [Eikenella corrodens]OAM16748.1 hypothetical protein A7P90_10920 [Eikenella corrodens]
MKKTSVFAALIAAFALTACGDNPAPAAASDASAASAASAPAASAPAASDAASAPAAAASDASAAAAAGDHWCQPWENKIEEYLASVKDEQRRKEFADIYAPLRQNMRNIQENMMKTTPEQRKQECDALISQLEKDIAEDIEDAKSE